MAVPAQIGDESDAMPAIAVSQPNPLCATLTGKYPGGDHRHDIITDPPGDHKAAQCWQEIAEEPGCYIYLDHYHDNDDLFDWSGDCLNGMALRGMVTIIGDKHKSTGSIVNGKQHGRWVIEHSNGITDEGHYYQGKRHGRWIFRFDSYSPGPRIKFPFLAGNLANELPDGVWIFQYHAGDWAEISYRRGIEHGNQYFYDPSGKCVRAYEYRDGKLASYLDC